MKWFGKKNKKEKQEPVMQEAVLTLYACRKDNDSGATIVETAKRLFSDKMEQIILTDEENFCIQLKDKTEIQFHMEIDPKKTALQANGMANFFSQALLKNETVKQAALMQIRLFNCIVGINFLVSEDVERTQELVQTFYQMAKQLGALVLHPTMCLYHSDGRLLISIDGNSDFEEYYPEASSTILDREANEQEVDRERKNRSIAILKQKNIPYMEHLKASVFEAECHIPDKAQIIQRLVCIFAASVRSEVYTSGQFENCEETAADQFAQLDALYQIAGCLSPEEKAYLESPDAEVSQHNKFGWRYECCAVLLWALSMIEMQEPTEICDAAKLGSILWNHTFDSLMESAVVRSKEEILDFQDLVLRYDWACVDARIHHKPLSILDGDIVYEWHYALNWLVQADGITQWDDVTTTT